MMQLNIMSFLATQNLQCTKLIVWLLKDFNLNVKNSFIGNKTLELRVFDLKELCRYRKNGNGTLHSSFENHSICLSIDSSNEVFSAKTQIGFSDFVRFVVLDICGEIYVDGDVIFLKDTRILWNGNFAYRWSFVNYTNTAALG
jgi:hypothetical protein